MHEYVFGMYMYECTRLYVYRCRYIRMCIAMYSHVCVCGGDTEGMENNMEAIVSLQTSMLGVRS